MEYETNAVRTSNVQELRSLYRAAEARLARLRFIIETRALLDAAAFGTVASDILSRLAAFAGAARAILSVSASHDHEPVELRLGRLDVETAEIAIEASKNGIDLVFRYSGRPADPDDYQALAVVLGQIIDAIGMQRQATDLERKRTELSALVARLIEAQEQERRRVAQDLHDGSAQLAAALGYRLQSLAARIGPTEAIRAELEDLAVLARRSVTEIRAAIADLRPPELDDLGLVAALRARLDAVDGLEVLADLDAAARAWPASIGIVFYRVAQEAIANVIKHARARRLIVRVFEDGGLARLDVLDDGRGMPPALSSVRGERLGILGMRERLALLGGRLDLAPGPSGGTRLTAAAPLAGRVEAQ